MDVVELIMLSLLIALALYWKYKAEYYGSLSKDLGCEYSDLEREVTLLRRQYEELKEIQSDSN